MVNPNRFYTYAYLREDRTPYYIGKGTGNRAFIKGKKHFQPPKDKTRIIFLKKNLKEEEAFKHEKYMISVFGRKDLGTGILHNKTYGGEGCSGLVHNEKTRTKLSKLRKGKYVGKNHPSYGKKRTEETKEKFRRINTGENNPFYGRTHSDKTKSVMSERTQKWWKLTFSDGRIFIIFGITSWAKENGYDVGALRKLRSGKVKYHKDIISVEKLTHGDPTRSPIGL
jgi:group I intron endonuclease